MADTNRQIFFIDTNILVYAYNKTDTRKQAVAIKLLERCWQKQAAYALSSQNLAEFFNVSIYKIRESLSIDEAEKIIKDICTFSHWSIFNYDHETVQHAIGLCKSKNTHFWDAVLAATMLETGVLHIYTENVKDFSKFDGITAVNPFE